MAAIDDTISAMSRPYEADEQVFQKLKAAGKSSWDEQADPAASFDRFVMRPFLEESLAAMAEPLEGLLALEIGCGSGPISCFLAAKGLVVRGIDVSPTALDMARRSAAERGLTVQFDTADICRISVQASEVRGLDARYDLIVDGHCLHCLTSDEDRHNALAAVRRLLKPDGLFLIETMISHPGLVIGANYLLDSQCVLSIRVDDPTGVDAAFASDGARYAPYRRLQTADGFIAELRETGFTVGWQRAMEQKDPRKPMLFQVRATRNTT